MNLFLFVIISSGFFTSTLVDAGEQWAFLVAGSNGWTNYRHQADLCHAYQLMLKAGMPAENIVTMFYDDVAHAKENPNPGVLINSINGTNVYEGVVKDYTGSDVTVKNLLNVLTGDVNATKGIGSGRVIASGPEDTVLLYIVDHGSPGFVDINEDLLYADQLNGALKFMKKNKLAKKVIIFLEACEGGSMFDSQIEDLEGVFAITAAAPDESSYVSFYDDDLSTYVGDSFSITWMEVLEQMLKSSQKLHLFRLYDDVRTAVTKSHVMIYGDYSVGFDNFNNYLNNKSDVTTRQLIRSDGETNNDFAHTIPYQPPQRHRETSSRDVQLSILKNKQNLAKDVDEKAELQAEIDEILDSRDQVDTIIDQALSYMSGKNRQLYSDLTYNVIRPKPSNFQCYRSVIKVFNKICIDRKRHPYVNSHFHKFLNICQYNVSMSTVRTAFKKACNDGAIRSLNKPKRYD